MTQAKQGLLPKAGGQHTSKGLPGPTAPRAVRGKAPLAPLRPPGWVEERPGVAKTLSVFRKDGTLSEGLKHQLKV